VTAVPKVAKQTRVPEYVHLLEFSRTPSVFTTSLLNCPELLECKRELQLHGFGARDPRVLPSGAKVFVQPSVFPALLEVLEDEQFKSLQPRHVIVDDSHLDTVRGVIRGLPREANVYEKTDKHRCFKVEEELQAEEFFWVKHTFVHITAKNTSSSRLRKAVTQPVQSTSAHSL
jgi:hypothetical protein